MSRKGSRTSTTDREAEFRALFGGARKKTWKCVAVSRTSGCGGGATVVGGRKAKRAKKRRAPAKKKQTKKQSKKRAKRAK
jgi:hypothetical protein